MTEQKEMEAASHHVVSPTIYIIVLFALILGTAATVWASFLELGPWNPIIALAIATGKALLVVLFFMHVKYAS
ncbi:MAG: cytochrome C oxidase subunit IV family protein [Terracidiphilus sp.]